MEQPNNIKVIKGSEHDTFCNTASYQERISSVYDYEFVVKDSTYVGNRRYKNGIGLGIGIGIAAAALLGSVTYIMLKYYYEHQ